MPNVELSAGTIEYQDTGGSGPIVVPVHGILMDGTVWRKVVADLATDHRCVVPTLPLGAHRLPMRAESDLSLSGIARLLGEFLERIELSDVTLVVNDWGGPLLTVAASPARIGRLVLTPCEAFENIPPGLPGRMARIAGLVPGGIYLTAQTLRVPALRRLPLTFGWMSKRPVPDEVFERWIHPCSSQPEIRRDLRKYMTSPNFRRELLEATERLRSFDRPALVAWAAEDRVMPPEHGRRLAELLPHGRLVEIGDSYTIIPEDQPLELAGLIRQFVARN